MTAEEILTNLYEKYSNGNEWDLALDNIKKYANQRVIDELETFIDHSGKYYGVDYAIKERIKELKQ